jgi:DNA-binding transcriptional regulator of glucitol operon
LGHWQTRHLSKTKTIIADKPVLLVTEFEGLLQKGSVINFVIREGSIKFELSKSNAEAQGLQTDMRLVQLAYSVVE